MSYRIKTHGRIGAELQRLAEEQIAAAQAQLRVIQGNDEAAMADAIHEARKHFKKLRALIQLLREPLGAKAVREMQAFYRDAGRAFQRVRDAQAQVEAFDKLTGRFFEKRRPLIVLAARRILTAAEQRASRALLKSGTVGAVLADLTTAREAVATWETDDFRWKELRTALRRSYRRARDAWSRACAEPKPGLLHDWRGRTKDLWYHLSLARSAAPDFLDEVTGELEVLGEFLGDDRDLVGLRELIERHPRELSGAKARDVLLEILTLRREELLDAAFDLAGRVFAGTPGEFIRDLEERRDEHRQRRKKAKRVAEKLAAMG